MGRSSVIYLKRVKMFTQHKNSETNMSENNTVLIGKKPVMNYVLACLTLIQNGADLVTIKARGRNINTAVDTAQIVIKRFASELSVKKIGINTEELKSTETGRVSNVSSIEIKIGK